MIILVKKTKIYIALGLILILLVSLFLVKGFRDSKETSVFNIYPEHPEVEGIINDIFSIRNKALLTKDTEALKSLYKTDVKFGLWAYEHELKKMKYLHLWSEKQGVKFNDIRTIIRVRYVKDKTDGYQVNFTASTEYEYSYNNEPNKSNISRIGTYHLIDLSKDEISKKDDEIINFDKLNIETVEDENLKVKKEEDSEDKNYMWVITKEWYTDPFADSLHLDNIKSDEVREYIASKEYRDFSNINQRRKDAVEYADKYAGAASEEEYGLKYNSEYKNYNPLGGDCANFASQILHEGGNFKKNYTWNYERDGTKAWVNAQGFKDYMVYSGRASVIAKGNYQQVYKASYKLLPGDFVAYEKKGKVTHISVVTGADSKGYSLVNCHNTDRYRVPWDLGWSDKGIKFWLVRVHY